MARKWYRLPLWRVVAGTTTDWQTFYLWRASNTSATQSRQWIPISWTITKVRYTQRVGGLGSNELWSAALFKNWSTTWVTITSAIDSSQEHFTATVSCSVSVTRWTDYISVAITNPTWVTNPTSVLYNASVFIEYT